MCPPVRQDEIDWSAFGIDERVILVVSPPGNIQPSSSFPFCHGRMLANTQESIMMIWRSKALERREHPPMN